MKPYYEEPGIIIYHGDCRNILPQLKPVDLVLTDPPYGINANKMTLGSGKHDFVRGSKWDNERQLVAIESIFEMKVELCIWGGNYYSDILPPTNSWMIWHKKNDGLSFSEAEMAWTNYSPQIRVYSKFAADRKKLHPTEKPIELINWCITYSKTKGTVLDPFMGSGTTLRAAKDLGRKTIGIEIEEKYCEIAVKRLQQEVFPF